MNRVSIIAEIGWNHMGEIDLAQEMISAAKNSGADIIKFQYWDPKFLKPGDWDSDGRREIYNSAALNESKILKLKEITESEDCEFLISVFGTSGARFMYDLGLRKIKIPSHEVANIRLLDFCANHFDFIYFSSGASEKHEVLKANEILMSGRADYNLMHCVSSYPCSSEVANLQRINWLKSLSQHVGFSDHTGSTVIPASAVAMGCTVVEKHFTTDKSLPGRDNKFALDTGEFELMCANIRSVESAMTNKGLDYQSSEKDIVENYRGRWEPHDYA